MIELSLPLSTASPAVIFLSDKILQSDLSINTYLLQRSIGDTDNYKQKGFVNMENRWSIRKDLYLDIILYLPEDREIVAKIYNIGLEGVFISIDPAEYKVGNIINIGVNSPVKEDEILNARGIVRHISQNGIGVMFFGFNLKLFQSLQKYLYCNTPVLNSAIDEQALVNIYSR